MNIFFLFSGKKCEPNNKFPGKWERKTRRESFFSPSGALDVAGCVLLHSATSHRIYDKNVGSGGEWWATFGWRSWPCNRSYGWHERGEWDVWWGRCGLAFTRGVILWTLIMTFLGECGVFDFWEGARTVTVTREITASIIKWKPLHSPSRNIFSTLVCPWHVADMTTWV